MIGILIRVFFMPFTFMEGLLFTYRRSAILLFSPNTGMNIEQLIIESFQSAYLFIINNIFPYFENIRNILLHEEIYWSWYNFSTDEYVFRTLFIFKLFYFIFDIIGAFLIIRFFKNRDNKVRVFKYWMLSPLIIFIVYIIGRLDIIPIVFMILAFYLAKTGKRNLSYFVFILTILMRFFPLLILPLFIGYISKKKWDYIAYWGMSLSIFAILELLMRLLFSKSLFVSLFNSYHFRFLFTSSLGIAKYDKIIIFALVYLAILFFYSRSKNKDFGLFIKYSALVYLILFTFSIFYPQYFLWTIPFLLILFVSDRKLLILHIAQFIFLLILTPYWWKWPYSNEIFISIDHDFFLSFPNLAEITEVFYPEYILQNIFRVIFVSITLSMCAFIIYSIVKGKTLENEEK